MNKKSYGNGYLAPLKPKKFKRADFVYDRDIDKHPKINAEIERYAQSNGFDTKMFLQDPKEYLILLDCLDMDEETSTPEWIAYCSLLFGNLTNSEVHDALKTLKNKKDKQ